MMVGETVCTAIALPGIPAGTTGTIKEIGRLFVLVAFEDGRDGYYPRRQLVSIPQCTDPDDRRFREGVPLGIADLRVPRGSHCCLLPSTQSAALNDTASFTAAGLRNGETVVCGVPSKWQIAFASCLRQMGTACDLDAGRDRLVMICPSKIYLPRAQFTGQRQLDATIAMLSAALGENPNGIRAFAHAGRRHALPGWWEYEERITSALKDTGTTSLCVYDSSGWGSESWRMATDLHAYVVRDGLVSRGGAPAEQE
jgi:hypothetical protein